MGTTVTTSALLGVDQSLLQEAAVKVAEASIIIVDLTVDAPDNEVALEDTNFYEAYKNFLACVLYYKSLKGI